MIEEIIKSALTFFVIMGPFSSIPIFLAVTKYMNPKQKLAAATQAIVTAGAVLFAFLFFGQFLLDIFMIDFASLSIAGGLVLTILGIELMLSLSISGKGESSPAITLLATPLLTGPGVIVTTMIFVQQHGYLITSISALISLMASWIILWFSGHISRVIGTSGTDIVSRVTGLLLTAFAIQLIISGIKTAFLIP
ncbi:MAG: MarC family protein [Candidatus Hadarchaeum sp.]|uniref:MarC family protein n=1 Tax=Candidatus Hadarchaeum sp. TaxID=2883567 RepID=UPI003D12E6AC